MPYSRKTWVQKMADKPNLPKIITLAPSFPCAKALAKMGARPGDSVVICQPREVFELMSRVPEGRLTTLREICVVLAELHGADYCCTLTTGIQVMVAAHAAVEAELTMPYWRTLKMDGYLNEKYPGGVEAQRERLEREGHKVMARGKRTRVIDHEERLMTFPDHHSGD